MQYTAVYSWATSWRDVGLIFFLGYAESIKKKTPRLDSGIKCVDYRCLVISVSVYWPSSLTNSVQLRRFPDLLTTTWHEKGVTLVLAVALMNSLPLQMEQTKKLDCSRT